MTAATQHALQINGFTPIIPCRPACPAPAGGHLGSPLTWWRTRTPGEFELKDATILRRELKGTTIDGERNWPSPITRQITTTIRTAVDLLKMRSLTHPEIDLALSALLAFAIDGDVTAGILISSALRRRSHLDPPCRILGDLWLVADLNLPRSRT